MEDNNFLTNENKLKIAIQKRKITILKKRLLKAEKKSNNIEKRAILAGESYMNNIVAEPNPKFVLDQLIQSSTTDRKKYEKHIIKETSGINDMFIIKTLYNVDLLNTTTNMDVTIYDENFNLLTVEKELIEPNYEYMKGEIYTL